MLGNTLTVTGYFVNETTGADTASEQLTLTLIGSSVNRSTYGEEITHTGGATHTDAMRNQVQFYRTYAKRSGSSRGSFKGAVKFTRDVAVDNADGSGQIVLPALLEISTSLPVGMSHAEISNLRRRAALFLLDAAETSTEADSAIGKLTEGMHEI
jgi:hypothetical protein